MPNGHDPNKKYGTHLYPAGPHATSDCKYNCGCWAGPSRSGSKTPGIDPFGECPGNPADGKTLGGTADAEIIINRRISDLQGRAHKAEDELKRTSPAKKRLAARIEELNTQVDDLRGRLRTIRKAAEGR